MMAIVAIELIEAIGTNEAHPFLVAVEMQARDSRRVRRDVRLAGKRKCAACALQVFTDGNLADRQRYAIPGRAVAGDVAASVEGHARGPAYAGLNERAIEAHTAPRELVQMRRR